MKNTLILFFLILVSQVNGQDQPALRLHFQGYNLVFPGVELAYQYPILTQTLNKEKQNKLILNIAPVADFYVQKMNHTGIGLTGELNLQYQSSRGFITEFYGGVGMQGAVLAGEIFELNAQGEFATSKWKGNIYRSWKAGIGLAKVSTLKSGRMVAYHFRLGVRHAKTPGALLVPNVNVGLNYFLNKTK